MIKQLISEVACQFEIVVTEKWRIIIFQPENVVFFERLGMVKLTDFGFSNLYEPGQQLQTSCGSLAYSAPEILLGDAYDAPAVGENFSSFFLPFYKVYNFTCTFTISLSIRLIS